MNPAEHLSLSQQELFAELLQTLSAECRFGADLPRETALSTLCALWHFAGGTPCSAEIALATALAELTAQQQAQLRSVVAARIQGTPLAHITQRMHFMGTELLYEPEVLMPRPETELLGNSLVEAFTKSDRQDDALILIEVGCGSGNLTCGIARQLPNAHIYAIDVTAPCVQLTQRNVELHDLRSRVTPYCGDMFTPLETLALSGKVDAVFSNPPYFPTKKLAERTDLLQHEPKEAFDGGPFGFSVHQRLIREAAGYLKKGGCLLFEFGAGQHRQVAALLNRAPQYQQSRFIHDANDNPRVALALL